MAARESRLDLVRVESADPSVIAAAGTLDIATVDKLEEMVASVLGAGHDVIVDVSGLTLCDSTGLGAFVRLHRRAGASGRGFALRAPRRHVADVLAMTGIDKIITVLSDSSG